MKSVAKETFFVVQMPPGVTGRQWGKAHAQKLGFDYDNNSRRPGQLLVWAHGVLPSTLASRLRSLRMRFMSFDADPKKMFGIT
jgi:hypothetical protein